MTSPDAFFIFYFNFDFLSCWKVKMVKSGPKWQKKNSFCLTPCLRNCTSYDCSFWYTCVKWWYLQHFFFFLHIFKILIFGDFRRRLKGQKMTNKYQFQSVTFYISRTVDHIMKIVGTQVLNYGISRYFSLFCFYSFFHFSKY